jgi:hypothetical protein
MCDKAAIAAKTPARLALASAMLGVLVVGNPTYAQLTDPMAPPGASQAGATESVGRGATTSELQGVINGPGRRFAVINGNVVQVGERIPGDGELLSVGPDSATVRSGEKNIELRLHGDSVKKDSKP